MKKIITILIIFSTSLFAQNETDCPFQAQKYVPYDGEFTSNTSYLPVYYSQLLQNNNNYDRPVSHLTNPAIASCFYKTSIHNHDSILKPFVFVEGISFEKRGINNNLYTMASYFRQDWYPSPPPDELECIASFNSAPLHLNDNVGYSTFNWATLVTGIDAEGYHAGDPLKVEKSPELLNQLCCAGYDICFVDFMSGEAYIESNGEALYSILVQLHQKLVDNNSNEKMVVCGASMGGLVARYAINKLEAEGHTDWVEKFISFDAPQMGANIPLGLQYTLKHLKGLSNEIEDKYTKLVCPSASQLVNYSCLETNLISPITFTTPSPSIERAALLNNPYMGWPQHCTKISISNGSRLGLTQSDNHQVGEKVLDIDGLIDLDIYSLPLNDNNYKKVFDFDPPYCVTSLLSAMPLGAITQQSIRVKNTMALDLAPGSFRTDLVDIRNQLPSIVNSVFGQALGICNLGWIDNAINSDRLCFIPFWSSIGAVNYEVLMKANSAVATAVSTAIFDGDSKFVDPSHTVSYFDVVYAPTSNQSHVEITYENIDWVMHELTGMPETIIHQNKFLLSNTYKASNFITAGNNIFNDPDCNQTQNGNGVGPIGNIGSFSPCGDVVVLNNNNVFYKAGGYISLEPGFYTQDGALFEAEIINISNCYSNGRMAPTTNETVINTNNSVFESVKKEPIKSINSFIENSIQLFPNPANNIFDISSSETIESIAISSLIGTNISSTMVNEKNFRISTSDLANGIYLVNIKTPTKTAIKKVVVRHE